MRARRDIAFLGFQYTTSQRPTKALGNILCCNGNKYNLQNNRPQILVQILEDVKAISNLFQKTCYVLKALFFTLLCS